MAKKVVMNRGKESIVNKQAVDSGSVWFTDEGNLYVDLQDNVRIKVTDILIFNNEDELNNYKESHSIKNKLIVITQNGTTKLFIGTSTTGSTFIVDSSNKNPFYISSAEFIPYNISYGIGEYSLDKYSLFTSNGIIVNSPENNSFVFDRNNKVGIIKETVDRNVICYIINNSSNASIESSHQEATYYADKNTVVGTASNGSLFYPYTKWSNILNAKNVYFEKYIKIINNSVGLKINEINDNVTELHIKGEGVNDLITLAIDVSTQHSMSFENVDIVINNENNKNTLDVNLSSLETIKIINSNVLENCLYLQAKYILIQNATIDKLKIKASVSNGEIIIRNSTINSLEIIHDYTIEDTVSLNVTIQDSKIKDLLDNNILKTDDVITYCDNLKIINTEINKTLNVNIDTISFIGGKYIGDSDNFKINANTINLGLFDLNGIDISNITGTINTSSNLTSNRIYDAKERSYGIPEKPYLDSHLDAISKHISQVKNYVDESTESVKELLQSEYWISDGLFANVNELSNEKYKNGSVLKFIGDKLTYGNIYEMSFNSLKLFNTIDNVMEISFNLVNGAYRAKVNDEVRIHFKYGSDSKLEDVKAKVSSIDINNINIVNVKCTIPSELLYINDINEVSAKNAELENTLAMLHHYTQCNNGDRLIKVANGWDKLIDITGTIWTSETDGEGSGLEADIIDGFHANQFAGTDSTIYTELPTRTGIYSYRTNTVSGKYELYTLFVRYNNDNDKSYLIFNDNTNGLCNFNFTTNTWESITGEGINAPSGMLGSNLKLINYKEQPLKFQTNDTDDGFIYLTRIRNHNVYYKWVTTNSLITGITIHVKLNTDTSPDHDNTFTYTEKFQGYSIATCSIIETNDEMYDRLLIAGCIGLDANCELHLLDLDLKITNNAVSISTIIAGEGCYTNIILSDGSSIYNAINPGSSSNRNIARFGDFYANESICYLTLRTDDASSSQSSRYNWGIFKVNIDRNSNNKWYTTYGVVHTTSCDIYTNFINLYVQCYNDGYRTPYELFMYPNGDLNTCLTLWDSSSEFGDEHEYFPESDTFYVVTWGSNPGERAQYFYTFDDNGNKSIITLFDGNRFSYEPSPYLVSTITYNSNCYYLFVQNIGVNVNNILLVNTSGKTLFNALISGAYEGIRYDDVNDVFCIDVGNGYEGIYKLI